MGGRVVRHDDRHGHLRRPRHRLPAEPPPPEPAEETMLRLLHRAAPRALRAPGCSGHAALAEAVPVHLLRKPHGRHGGYHRGRGGSPVHLQRPPGHAPCRRTRRIHPRRRTPASWETAAVEETSIAGHRDTRMQIGG